MKRTGIQFLSLALVFSAVGLCAQAPSASAPTSYRGPVRDLEGLYKRNLQQIQLAAEAMPAEDFHFTPHPGSPSFAELVRTVIDGEHAACDEVNETPALERSPIPQETASKDELIGALKAASAACDKSYAALTLENAADLRISGNTKRGQLSILAWNYAHNSEQYGMMTAYLQDKGIKPAAPPRPRAAATGTAAH